VTATGRQVAAWLTEPDGNYVQIGDSDDSSGISDPTATGPVFNDPAAGYIIGRWSWSNPDTTYYTIRFGPGRRAHGHFDRGSVTWSALGSRILVGPGRYAYNSSAYATWRTTRAAQNVAIPVTGQYDDRRSSTIIGSKVQAAAHAWTEQDNLYGSTHTRAVTVNAVAHTLRVTDSYAGTGLFHQLWHLDPAWDVVSAPANAKQLVFYNAVSGRTLTITTTGLLSSVVRGQMNPVGGYTSPAMGVLTPDCQVTLRSSGGPVTTTFAVS
jgi:hypothetical protein